jgi:hypothetical protein
VRWRYRLPLLLLFQIGNAIRRTAAVVRRTMPEGVSVEIPAVPLSCWTHAKYRQSHNECMQELQAEFPWMDLADTPIVTRAFRLGAEFALRISGLSTEAKNIE